MRLLLHSLFFLLCLSVRSGQGYREPLDAFPRVEPSADYEPRGTFIVIDDLTLYVSERAFPGNGERVVVWGHDIFGPTSGRTYELVDRLADETEYTVVLPDFFRGAVAPPSDTYEWETHLKFDWEDIVMPYVQDTLGATSVGTVGTCWGSYLVVHASTYSLVKAGFSAHPAHPQTQEGFGESEEETYQAINDNNNAAQFFNPTEGDSDTLRPGGLASQTLNVLEIIERDPPCLHGYFNRGDLNDPEVYFCVEDTFLRMKDFFAEYL